VGVSCCGSWLPFLLYDDERAHMARTEPIYPDVEVQLIGMDGNGFSIMGRVVKALEENGVTKKETRKFMDECMSGDYDHLLQTCIKWVSVS
jgi:hypothetical protein